MKEGESEMIFDTHAHYDSEGFDKDREELLSSLRERGIAAVVNVGATLSGARESASFAARFPSVYAAVGIHPDEVGCMNETVMEELETLCRLEKTVAVGEIGLDYHWNVESKEVQKKWFLRQLALAKETDLPVNVHSREAAQDTFDLIKAEHAGSTGGIIHCFSGSVEMAREYVRMGYFLGIGGVVTFKNGKTLKQVVREIPLEFLVTETDCPYLAPVPFRGKRNDSSYIRYIIRTIAELKGMPEEETEAVLYENAKKVYRIKR